MHSYKQPTGVTTLTNHATCIIQPLYRTYSSAEFSREQLSGGQLHGLHTAPHLRFPAIRDLVHVEVPEGLLHQRLHLMHETVQVVRLCILQRGGGGGREVRGEGGREGGGGKGGRRWRESMSAREVLAS